MAMILGVVAIIAIIWVLIELVEEWYITVRDVVVLILSIILLIFCVNAGVVRSKSEYKETIETNRYELVTLQDDSQIHGNISGGMFYVYGSINTEEVYKFYYKTSDGGFVKGKVDSNKTVIYENNDCDPAVVEYTTFTKSTMNDKLQKWLFFDVLKKQTKNYKIYVPKGTVANEYTLDAK